MNNLEIIVTEDGRIELSIDGDGSFLLGNEKDGVITRMHRLLNIATDVRGDRGTCRLRMGEVDETA